MLICVPFKKFHQLALWLNHVWAWGFFRLGGMPVKRVWHFKPDPKQQYILCANHFSYLDIPAMGLFSYPFKFVGKSQLANIPVFGLMYRSIHITVNRSSYRSRATSLVKAREELKAGFNLCFFPEGGIRLKEFPKMVNFQDGAFRLAAENNVPIIPIVFPENHYILPDDGKFLPNLRTCRIIYKEPIHPEGTSEEEIKQLKEEVFRVIQTELNQMQ